MLKTYRAGVLPHAFCVVVAAQVAADLLGGAR